MEGFLDEFEQAFLTLKVGRFEYDFEVDTGFSGTLIVGEELFDPSDAEHIGTNEAFLANDELQTYQSYAVKFHWFDEESLVHLMVGPGKTCLIGTRLFAPHRLEIDYGQRTIHLAW